MVPLSERRHRIYEEEIPSVVASLKLLLVNLFQTRDDQEKAENDFRVLYRLMRDSPGRPKYPEFDWDYLSYFLYSHESRDKLLERARGLH